jgi:ABC-type transport system involved in cytochrome bd biosynthesis fused ATPase/permease subunit
MTRSQGAWSAGRRGSRVADAGIRPLVAVARPWLAAAIAVGFGQAVLLIVQAAVLAQVLSAAIDGGLTAAAAARASAAVALLALGQGLGGWAWETATEAAARRATAATRREVLGSAIRRAGAAYDGGRPDNGRGDPGPGGLATLLGSGVDELGPYVARVLPRIVLALAVPALLLAWIAHLDLVSAALAALVLVLAPLLTGLVGMDTAAAVRRRLVTLEHLGNRFAALVDGLPVLRAFGRAQDHERAVAASGEEVRAATLATLRIALLSGLVLELLTAAGTALVALRLGLRLDAGQRILPRALAVLMLSPELFLPLRRLTADFHAAATGRAALRRLGQLTAADSCPPPRASDAGAAADAPGRAGAGPVGVVLEGVGLSSAGRRRPALDGISLWIAPGERVCVVGESGAGKTSLLRVVAGLAAPSAGRSRLVGTGLGPGSRPVLGWVPQHPTILDATILDNIALGRPGVTEPVACAALTAVQLGPWLRARPAGLRTPLHGLDAPLSLGELRRLAVARCLAGPRPRLWLLDEPTAGLDQASAERLVAELSPIVAGVTAIVATHDPAAMALGQRTVQLGHGRVLGPAPVSLRAGQGGGSAARAR